MRVYFVSYRARPQVDRPDAKKVGGAYVSCWIRAATAADAQEVALDQLQAERWLVEAVEHQPQPAANADAKTMEHVRQAELDGACYVFHTWPVDDHSEDDLH